MTSIKTEVRRRDGAQAEVSGRNPERAALRVEMKSAAGPRTKAETKLRLQCHPRTAVCGTACTVVWEGGGGDPAPYPILEAA